MNYYTIPRDGGYRVAMPAAVEAAVKAALTADIRRGEAFTRWDKSADRSWCSEDPHYTDGQQASAQAAVPAAKAAWSEACREATAAWAEAHRIAGEADLLLKREYR